MTGRQTEQIICSKCYIEKFEFDLCIPQLCEAQVFISRFFTFFTFYFNIEISS